MPHRVREDQVALYARDGYLFPVPALSAAEVALWRGELEAWERERGAAIDLSYIPAHVRPVGALRPSALCVRGRDHGHFLPEARLQQPLSDAAFRAHREALQRFRAWQDAGFAPAAAV